MMTGNIARYLIYSFAHYNSPVKTEKSMLVSRGIIMAPLLSNHHQKEILWGDYDRVVKIDTLKMSRRRIWGSRHIFQTWLLSLQVFVTSGLGGMSGAQAKAAVIAGCIGVVAEVWDMRQDIPVSKCYTNLSVM